MQLIREEVYDIPYPGLLPGLIVYAPSGICRRGCTVIKPDASSMAPSGARSHPFDSINYSTNQKPRLLKAHKIELNSLRRNHNRKEACYRDAESCSRTLPKIDQSVRWRDNEKTG